MQLTMQTPSANYPIILERGCIKSLSSYTDLERKVLILTDQNIPQQWVDLVTSQCSDHRVVTVAGGEESKSMNTYQSVLEACFDFQMTRKDLMIALGGGVIGDLCGFVAATYMRGIEYVSIPTSTLSQIDSSIGGKTAINLNSAKNIVGAFHHPSAVFIDFDTLSTLPHRHFINGLAEAIKAGLICDPVLFELFEQEDLESHLEEIIYRSLCVKQNIVQQDEKETGLRKLLNFGHTIGHGIESYYHLETFLHGECVAMGMFYFITDSTTKGRLKSICERLGLPVTADFSKEDVYNLTLMDKKASTDSISTVWVDTPGTSYIRELPKKNLLSLF